MSQRVAMIMEYEQGGYSVAALARRYGISRKSANKWIERFQAEEWAGLHERSRARHTQAHAFGAQVEEHVVALKAQWPHWGAPKIRHKLLELIGAEACPGESTVGNILRRNGLTHKMKARRMRAHAVQPSYGEQNNQTWCADFKGWWLTKDGQRCDPLTITDASSRYLIRCQGLSGSTRDAAGAAAVPCRVPRVRHARCDTHRQRRALCQPGAVRTEQALRVVAQARYCAGPHHARAP